MSALQLLCFICLLTFYQCQLGKAKKKQTPPTNNIINAEDIGRYINQIRTSPSMLIPLLQQRLTNGRASNIQQWHQAIDYVKNLQKLPTYNYSIVLQRAALDHIQQLSAKNTLTHVGNNGSSLVERIQKYTDWKKGTTAEALIYQPNIPNRNHPLEILISLIVNEGMNSKAYRNAFFNEQYRYYGVSVRMNSNKGIAVFLFSTQLFDLQYPDQESRQLKGSNSKKFGIKNQKQQMPAFGLSFNKPSNNLFGQPKGFSFGGHKKRGFGRIEQQPDYSKQSQRQRNVIVATVDNDKVTKTYDDGSQQTTNK